MNYRLLSVKLMDGSKITVYEDGPVKWIAADPAGVSVCKGDTYTLYPWHKVMEATGEVAK